MPAEELHQVGLAAQARQIEVGPVLVGRLADEHRLADRDGRPIRPLTALESQQRTKVWPTNGRKATRRRRDRMPEPWKTVRRVRSERPHEEHRNTALGCAERRHPESSRNLLRGQSRATIASPSSPSISFPPPRRKARERLRRSGPTARKSFPYRVTDRTLPAVRESRGPGSASQRRDRATDPISS